MIDIKPLFNSPQSTAIVTIDDIRILIDPGSDALLRFTPDTQDFKPDLILLSHSDLAHLGGYVYGYRHSGWKSVPTYATLPVVNMGRTTMYDALKNALPEDVTLADIDDAFDAVVALRYSQATRLSGRCQGITISAFNAGHTLGGSLWKIIRGSEHLVYATDWNHAKDEHLNGCALFSGGVVPESLVRPTLLITDALNARAATVPRSKRNTAIFESIKATVSGSGSVLIPVDASSRVLELCEILEEHWEFNKEIQSVPLFFISHSNIKTIGYAKSMLEWMNDKMINSYGSSGGLFDFKHIRMLSTFSQATMLPPGPKVILATSSDLQHGFSQQILRDEIASNPANMLILTQNSTYSQESLAGTLMTRWIAETEDLNSLADFISLDLQHEAEIRRHAPLEGQELKDYKAKELATRDSELARTAMEERNRNILDANDSESEDEEEAAMLAGQGTVYQSNQVGAVSIGSSVLLNTAYDFYLDTPQVAKLPARLKSFPFIEKRRRFDDYGEILRPDEFKRADQEEVEAETILVADKSKDTTGKKRKWNQNLDTAVMDNLDESVSVPSKLVVTKEQFRIQCRLRYVDMEGLHDGKSLKNIIESVNPRKLILVHASEAEKLEMKASCEQMKAFTKLIAIPILGETTGISLDTNAYDVRLSDSISGSLHWQQLHEQEVAHVTGKLIPQTKPDSTEPPILTSLTADDESAYDSRTSSLFVGDVRLADLRRTLTESGHSAELQGGGVLLCDRIVSVTKVTPGEVLLQGQATDQFHAVREKIYQSLAVIEST